MTKPLQLIDGIEKTTQLEVCRKLRDAYLEASLLLELAEATAEPEVRLEVARTSAIDFRRSWLSSVRRAINEPSLTPSLLLEKAQILLDTLQELCTTDDEFASVTIAFVEDLQRLFRQDHTS